MKKAFSLSDSKHKPARIIDSIRSDIKKYLKRERAKKLPENADFWDFDCKIGKSVESADVIHVSKLSEALDPAIADKWESAYVEIIAKPRTRQARQ